MSDVKRWDLMYDYSIKPLSEQISNYVNNTLWEQMNDYLKETYGSKPEICYSKCSAQKGWNVKHKKSGKALCTLYPMYGYFIALIVISPKQEALLNHNLTDFSDNVQEIYKSTRSMPNMGRWLMISVTDQDVLNDVKKLINLKTGLKSKV